MSWRSAASRTTGRPPVDRVHRPQACGPTGPRPRSCSGGCRAGRRGPAEMGASSPVSRQQPQPDRRHRSPEELVQLGGDPLARQVRDQLGSCLDPGQRRGLDRRTRGSPTAGPPGPSGAHPPRTVALGIADRAQHAARRASASPSYGSTNARRLARPRAPGHRVDREVAPRQVELDRVAELDPVRPPEVGVVVVGPERRDVEDLAVAPDRRPSRTGSRRRRPGSSSTIRSGRASDARSQSSGVRPRTTSRNEPPTTYAATTGRPERLEQGADGCRDRAVDGVRPAGRGRQLRPRNRYERHASLRSSPRYGVNSE